MTLLAAYAKRGGLFLFAYGLWLCATICEASLVLGIVPPVLFTMVKYFALALSAVSALENGLARRMRDWPALACALALSVAVRVASGSSVLLFVVAFVYCARDVDLMRIARATVIATVATCAVIVLMSQMGIILDYVWDPEQRERHGLGFTYCTFISHFLLNVAIAVLVLRGGNLKTLDIVLLLAADLLILLLTDSRNSFLLVLLVIAISLVARAIPLRFVKNELLLRALSQWTLLFLVCASLLLCLGYDPTVHWMASLNDLLSNRLYQTHESLQNYLLLPFGQSIEFLGNGIGPDGVLDSETFAGGDQNFVDNSYLSVLLNYGFLPLICIVCLLVAAGGRVARAGAWSVAIALFVFYLHSSLDPQMLSLQYSFPLFSMTVLLTKQPEAFLIAGDEPGRIGLLADCAPVSIKSRSEETGSNANAEPRRRWYHIRLGNGEVVSLMGRLKKKYVLIGCVISVVLAIALAAYGYSSVAASNEEANEPSFTVTTTLNVVAVSNSGDSQSTINSLSGTAANDVTDYIKTNDLRIAAFDTAKLAEDERGKYGIGVTHSSGTRVIMITVWGPDKSNVEKLSSAVIRKTEETAKQSFRLASLEKVSDTTTEDKLTAEQLAKLPSPLKTAVLYAAAGLVIGVLLSLALYAVNPRVRSGKDAEEVANLPVIGNISI